MSTSSMFASHPALRACSVLPQRRHSSDKLLGYSPMAPSAPGVPSEETKVPTARDVEIVGGIWYPTSAKRDRLGELRVELAPDQYTLDDAATDQQLRDLHLADGVQWIAHIADTCRLGDIASSNAGNMSSQETTVASRPPRMYSSQCCPSRSLSEANTWIAEQETAIQSTMPNGLLGREQWENYLDEVIEKIDEQLATLPAARYLRHVRNFYTVPDDLNSALRELRSEISPSLEHEELRAVATKCLARYRLQLTRATCEHLRESWERLTTLTDEAVDRLAVGSERQEEFKKENGGEVETLSLSKVNEVLRACLVGNAADRFDSWWKLTDQNGDGLLEKTEMERVAFSTVTPVQWAIATLYEESLEASPVLGKSDAEEMPDPAAERQRWLESRRDNKHKKELLKAFQRATRAHFDDEIEMPHRLRCIYSWANKQHQENKFDSVLIEASGWSGRKRYVELPPKISLSEFREVQEIHLTHLDRIGWEITKSFREDLLVEQGRGRQNAELKRDCIIFLAVVSLVDYIILIL